MHNLESDRVQAIATEVYKILNSLSATYLADIIHVNNSGYNTRSHLSIPRATTTKYGQNCLHYAAPKIWNAIPRHIREQPTIELFKKELQTWAGPCCSCYLGQKKNGVVPITDSEKIG